MTISEAFGKTKKKGIIFTDVDGTLVFHEIFHGIRQLGTDPNSSSRIVQDPLSGENFSVLDVSVQSISAFLAESTRELAQKVKENYFIVFTTGATEKIMRLRQKNLDFADGYILENGGRILSSEYQEDEKWAECFKPYLETLHQIKADLERGGWQIVDAGRKTFLQVKAFENPHRTEAEFRQLCDTLELPQGFQKTFNLGNLTVLPEISGKGEAVAYFLHQFPEYYDSSIGIGDDFNDLDFLSRCQEAFVLGNALPEVIQIAGKNGWYISKAMHFAGINEIFKAILDKQPG